MRQTMITETVLEGLGIHRGYQGYAYVCYAIRLALQDAACLKRITKHLYPQIAEEFETTPACVERNLRTIIRVAVQEKDSRLFGAVFGSRGASMMCNKEFLSCLYEYVKMQPEN